MVLLGSLAILLMLALLGWLVWWVRQSDEPERLSRNQLDVLVTELRELADGWAGTDRGLAQAVKKKIDESSPRA